MQPIPSRPEPERYTNAKFVDSPFVEIVADDRFVVEMMYPELGMKHAERQALVREEVYARLVKATSFLPPGYKLKIWDAWRPWALQRELYEVYTDLIIKEFQLENCSEQERKAVIGKYIAYPSEDRDVPPTHATGGAVDLTLVDSDGKELDMGTPFDSFSEKTQTDYYEKEKDSIVKDNRRLLYWSMTRAGFTNLPSEWWHFDYGDRIWAYYNNVPTMFRGAFEKSELRRR